MENFINLLDIKVDMNGNVSPEINLTDKFVVKMKYPEFGIIKNSMKYDDDNEITFNMLAQKY
jgi:hypothetical protein